MADHPSTSAAAAVDATPAATLPPPGTEDALYLVDISGYVFRAFHALPPLTSPVGEPTGALYGVTSMLLKLVREKQPGMVAVVMDSKGPSFRKERYPEYKANRPPAPEDLKFQMGKVREVAEAYGMPVYEQEGVEADDLIASLTHVARARGDRVVVVSADKDLLQLVGEGVVMFDSMRDKVFGPAETRAKMGVPPEQVRDLLAFMGDASDNVPGVPKVGAKTAAGLLEQYGSMDGVYAALDEITRKALKKNLSEFRDQAYLSRELVTLKDDIELPYEREALRYGGSDSTGLLALFKRYGFSRLLDQLQGADPSTPAAGTVVLDLPPLQVITEVGALEDFAARLRKADSLCVACACEGEDPVGGALIGVALSAGDEAAYVPVGHAYLGCPSQLSASELVEALRELLEDPERPKLSAQAKRDRIGWASIGVALDGVTFDAMLASYLLDPDQRGHSMAQILLRRSSQEVPDYEAVAGKGKGQTPLGELRFEDVARYLAPQVQRLSALRDELVPELERHGLSVLLLDLELPLSAVLATVEQSGVRVDVDYLRVLSRQVDKELVEHERRCHALAGRDFNVASPRQLETILFDELGLPVISRTKTARSTNHDVLEELAAQHELPAAILEHRSLAKLKSTYLDALPREVSPRDGRIHTRFDQAVAATGRLSSIAPNLQNIPIRTEMGRRIREAFVGPEGSGIFSADYSQIELRVLAHLSEDPELVEAFSTGQDVHVRTATALFDVAPEQVTRDQRAAAKTVNFAVIYGQTQFALARNLRITRADAGRYIKAFFQRYDGVRRYLEGLVEGARETGEVRTLLGRRRLVKDIRSRNHTVRAGAERIAKNAPIQGSAADILKLAMVRTQEALQRDGMKARMVLTVHDELVFEAPESERGTLERLVREAMEGAYGLRVPLVVDTGWGESWGQAH